MFVPALLPIRPESSLLHSKNKITGILDETFSVTEDRFGEEPVDVELKPGGSEISVTEENKREYVDLVVRYWIVSRIKEQFDIFMDGVFEVIPRALITIFSEGELELLIGGASGIDMYIFNV